MDQAIEVFDKVEGTLLRAGDLTTDPRNSVATRLQAMMLPVLRGRDHDDAYFKKMSFVVFFSGFRASIVSGREAAISRYFGEVERAASMDGDAVEAALRDATLIRNRRKVTACIENAKTFLKIREAHGSFGEFLLGFGEPGTILSSDLDNLRRTLRYRFSFLGPVTVNHFLTDLGYPVAKPDRMVMRVLHRSGLVQTETDYDAAIKVCQSIAHETTVSMRYVDWVLVGLGMESRANICRLRDPRCKECLLELTCRFYETARKTQPA